MLFGLKYVLKPKFVSSVLHNGVEAQARPRRTVFVTALLMWTSLENVPEWICYKLELDFYCDPHRVLGRQKKAQERERDVECKANSKHAG